MNQRLVDGRFNPLVIGAHPRAGFCAPRPLAILFGFNPLVIGAHPRALVDLLYVLCSQGFNPLVIGAHPRAPSATARNEARQPRFNPLVIGAHPRASYSHKSRRNNGLGLMFAYPPASRTE